jgi:hypothetical protein
VTVLMTRARLLLPSSIYTTAVRSTRFLCLREESLRAK